MHIDSILTQAAIDALLADMPEDVAEVVAPSSIGGTESLTSDHSEVTASITPHSPSLSGSSKDNTPVTLDQVITLAGEAAEAETAPVQDSISRIYQRIGLLEQAIARITELEIEVDNLKRTA